VYFQQLSESNGFNGASKTLYGPDGIAVPGGYYFAGDFAATLPADGVYTLVIANNPATGPSTYSLEAYQTANPTTALTLGQEVSGKIQHSFDQANYTFTGSPGETIDFDAIGGASGINAILTDPGGRQVFSRSLAGTSFQSPVYTLSWLGTYTLTISG